MPRHASWRPSVPPRPVVGGAVRRCSRSQTAARRPPISPDGRRLAGRLRHRTTVGDTVPAARVVPVVEPEVVEIGDVDQPGEPELSTVADEPAAAGRPVKAAPVKKAAAKKAPAKKAAAKKAAAKKAAAPAAAAWVDPDGDVCPTSHPVKAKLGSKVFHLPGQLAYERTHPDRCYVDEAAAEADGLRKAKR